MVSTQTRKLLLCFGKSPKKSHKTFLFLPFFHVPFYSIITMTFIRVQSKVRTRGEY